MLRLFARLSLGLMVAASVRVMV
ncbi:hypothetical protein XPR_3717, partial [Xanthomonas arboricola pv. pruni MAFF 301420]